jgi:hypothetical protein
MIAAAAPVQTATRPADQPRRSNKSRSTAAVTEANSTAAAVLKGDDATQNQLICMAIGRGSPTAKTIHID